MCVAGCFYLPSGVSRLTTRWNLPAHPFSFFFASTIISNISVITLPISSVILLAIMSVGVRYILTIISVVSVIFSVTVVIRSGIFAIYLALSSVIFVVLSLCLY